MTVEDVCGAVTGSIMVLGTMFVDKKAHESDRIKILTREFIERFNKKMGTVNCRELKALYRDDDKRCMDIILAAGEILEDIVKRERSI
jgi:C_GCAxxG_C_C family probable redox protein